MTDKSLALRTCKKDGTSHGGFVWPQEVGSIVTCPDWNDKKECGGGLHGLLDGQGNYNLLGDLDNIWQVVEVDRDKCIGLNGKVKFEQCKIIYAGDPAIALTKVLINEKSASGDYSQLAASGGYSVIMVCGYNSKVKIGKNGCVALTYFCEKDKRRKISVGYEGIELEAHVWHILDDNGKFIKCEGQDD